jgi:hypothetical protein
MQNSDRVFACPAAGIQVGVKVFHFTIKGVPFTITLSVFTPG